MIRAATRLLTLRFLAPAFALTLPLVLAACGISVVQAPTGVTGEAKLRVLSVAGREGPILLQVAGAPFREGQNATAAFAVRTLSDVYPQVPEGFTLHPRRAGAPQYRFRLAFDPPAVTSPDRICMAGGEAPLNYDRRAARQRLFMVFCREDVAIVAAEISSRRMDTLRDPDFAALLLQGAQEMFTADPDEPDSLGILEFDPEPRLRLNPLEGLL